MTYETIAAAIRAEAKLPSSEIDEMQIARIVGRINDAFGECDARFDREQFAAACGFSSSHDGHGWAIGQSA